MTIRLPRTIRKWTRPLVGRVPIPIVSGPNRGRWWSLASAGSGFVTGRREYSRMRLIERLVGPDDRVWDVGAHYGYVTLCAARRVRDPRQVHAFEPSPGNRVLLHRHLAWNGLADVRIHPVALSDYDGVARFGGSGSSQTYALDRGTDLVEVRSGGRLIETDGVPAPTLLKIDVEGAEAAVLRGLLDHLPPTVRMLIAMHSADAVEQCRAQLLPRGYTLAGTTDLYRALSDGFGSDPDLLALGPEVPPLSAETIEIGELVTVHDWS